MLFGSRPMRLSRSFVMLCGLGVCLLHDDISLAGKYRTNRRDAKCSHSVSFMSLEIISDGGADGTRWYYNALANAFANAAR